MDPSQFGGMGVSVYLIVQFLKRILKSEGGIVLVLALLIGIGISEVDVIATMPDAAGRQQMIHAYLEGFYRGVMVAALAVGIHSAARTASGDSVVGDLGYQGSAPAAAFVIADTSRQPSPVGTLAPGATRKADAAVAASTFPAAGDANLDSAGNPQLASVGNAAGAESGTAG